MLRELESQSFVVLYSPSTSPILCGPVRSFAVFLYGLSGGPLRCLVLPPLWCLVVLVFLPRDLHFGTASGLYDARHGNRSTALIDILTVTTPRVLDKLVGRVHG